LLVLYQGLSTRQCHPWSEADELAPNEEAFADLRSRLRPFKAWAGGGPFDVDWFRHLEASLLARHALGQARGISRLLDPKVIETMRGDALLSVEIDRFFAALWQILGERQGGGLAPPSPTTLMSLAHPEHIDYVDDFESAEAVTIDTGVWEAMTPEKLASQQWKEVREQARQAARDVSDLIQLRPDDRGSRLETFGDLESSLTLSQSWEELAEHYRASLDLFESNEEVAGLLAKLAGIYHEHLERDEEATDLYLRAIRITPSDRSSLAAVDGLLRAQDRWEELAAAWQRAATGGDDAWAVEAWVKVADVLLEHLNNVPEAMRALRFALAADPDNETVREALLKLAEGPVDEDDESRVHFGSDDWKPLAEIAERWAEHVADPDEAADWYERASELYLRGDGDIDKAFECLGAALRRKPDRTDALSRLESLARQHDQWAKFVEIVEELLRRDEGGNAALLSRLAEVFSDELASDDRAAAIYLKCLEIDPTQDVALAFLKHHSSAEIEL
jgi:tetratricopeptide (TPR) repeat protein